MFKLTPRAGPNSLLMNLRRLKSEWSKERIAARIVVSPDLSWWYMQEFGTAIGGRSGQTDPTGGASGHTYEIHPKNNTVLSWTSGGDKVVVPMVKKHPGVPSHHFVTRTLADNLDIAAIKIISAMDRGRWSVSSVKASLLEEIMPRVKENIVNMIELTLPGSRPDGKLGGETAAEAFEAGAEIVDSSDIT